MPDSISNFTLAIVPFTYYSTLLPDSAIILASSSINGFRPNVGSKFIIDDITMVYTPAGLSVNEKNNNATIYPNPVNQFIHIDFELGSTNWVTLLDDAGRVLYTQLLLNQRNQVDFTLFEEGVYTLLIRGENNETAYRRLIIQH
nr:T9SS type A sorting domain-containing protein [Pseudopedobacter sp.]